VNLKEFPSLPVNGSFWITLSEGNVLFEYSLEEVDRSTENVVKNYAVNITKLLEYNLNKSITITIIDAYKKDERGNAKSEDKEVVVTNVFSP